MGEVEVGVLGPLRLRVDGRDVEVPGGRRRAALAVLALSAGRTVTVSALVDALWAENPPAVAGNSLQSHLSRLRAHLDPYGDLLVRDHGGYRLDLPPDAVDAHRAVTAAREARARGADPVAVSRLVGGVLREWRGRALGEFEAVPALAAEAVRLEELRLDLVDLLLDARLRSEPAAAVVDLASRAATEQLLREATLLLLVRALAASGRAADALAAARGFRRRLDEEAGLRPTPALDELERAVAAGDLDVPSPPRQAPRRATTRVATPLTPLLGREEDLRRLRPLLGSERCVTLVGPGGVGKTRLALELAHRVQDDHPDGVVLAELAQVQDPGSIGFVLAELLAVRGDDLVAAVCEHLAARQLVLVLDNCEHVVDVVGRLAERVLAAAPGVRILATSREPLGVPGEWVHRLAPLPVPPPDDPALEDSAAVRLFRDRAARATGSADVGGATAEELAEVCRRLDGLPLALELAASWLPAVGLAGLPARLSRQLDIGRSRRAGDDRHGTLRGTIAWSYDLLGEAQRRLFRHLSVVPDRFELSLAEYVAASLEPGTDPAAAVSRLVDCSMVVAEPGGPRPSLRLLESLRAFGLEQLSGHGEKASAEDMLSTWVLDLVTQAAAGLAGSDEPEWETRLVAALPTIRAARRSMLARGDVPAAATLMARFADFSIWREHGEVWSWALETAELPGIDQTAEAAGALTAAATGAWRLGRRDLARALVTRVRRLARPGADRHAASQVEGVLDLFEGRFGDAERHALAGAGDPPERSDALATAALAAGYAGRRYEALRLLDRADGLAARSGSPTLRAYAAYVRGEVLALDRSPEAAVHLRRAIDLARRSGASFVEQVARLTLASVAAREGDVREAASAYAEVIHHWLRTGGWTQQWTTLRNVAMLLGGQGAEQDAYLLLMVADAAPDASAVAGSGAEPLLRATSNLRSALGPDLAARLTARAAETPRHEAVDLALTALARLVPLPAGELSGSGSPGAAAGPSRPT
ncbi:MAG TPA: BTAD domain-containing putative transcriptional regulator [Jiangellales bacterium]|nr:BTAD domain-containing putative transcriptional regulator [Jiangellales bacterium]